jgi:tetratricopeptide (TPR) repeat protein
MRYLLVILLLSFVSAGCATNNNELFREIEELANSGSPEAQYHLGMFYNNGVGTGKDINQAFTWFEKSAMSGDPLGSYKLGCYYAGQGHGVVKNDSARALKYKLVAAESGYALAQFDVARIYYENGEIEEALRWFNKAADQGDPESFYVLFSIYFYGEKTPKDGVLAYQYLKIIERNARKNQVDTIRQKLTELENELNETQLEAALENASNWRPHKLPITEKALNGLVEARALVNKTNVE